MPDLTAQLSLELYQKKHLKPSPDWVISFLSSQRPNIPLTSLVQTALFRLLASEITTTLAADPSSCLPSDIHDLSIKERRLSNYIAVQVLSVEDLSKSRWEQIEAIEALERGEMKKGREIVRIAGVQEDGSAPVSNPGAVGTGGTRGPHKVLLQDAAGTKVWSIEQKTVEGISMEMNIGSKTVLKNSLVARGMVLLEPATVTVLGGKVEDLHKMWKAERKQDLTAQLATSSEDHR